MEARARGALTWRAALLVGALSAVVGAITLGRKGPGKLRTVSEREFGTALRVRVVEPVPSAADG